MLDEIESLLRTGDVAPHLGQLQLDPPRGVEPAADVVEVFTQQPHDRRVELDGDDPLDTLQTGAQDTVTAAGAENQDRRRLPQVVRQGRGGVIEIGERPAIGGPGHRRQGVTVDEEPQLVRRSAGSGETQAGRVSQRNGAVA